MSNGLSFINANRFSWSDDQHQDNHKEDDQNDRDDHQTDCNWNKAFHQDKWSRHHPCHVLEAVTWVCCFRSLKFIFGSFVISFFSVIMFLLHEIYYAHCQCKSEELWIMRCHCFVRICFSHVLVVLVISPARILLCIFLCSVEQLHSLSLPAGMKRDINCKFI